MFHSQKIKKMTALNNLISRVKNIFSRKATTVTAASPATEPPTNLSVVSDPRLKAALADIEKYLADNYRARCWMRCVRPSFLRDTMNLPSSSVSQSSSLVDVTPPSIITLSGR